MKTKFAISSHINFYQKTYPYIIGSMLEHGVPAEDIFFFIGGCEKYEKVEGAEVNVWKVNHNSVDFTGLVSVLDLGLKADRWFLLHDTLYVGPEFYPTILNHPTQPDVIAMSQLWSKNMGSLSQAYLDNIAPVLLSEYKNTRLDKDAAHQFKTMNIATENRFLVCQDYYTTQRPIIKESAIDFYQTGTPRDIQYYFDIDIYKVQSHTAIHQPGNYNLAI
jgi:hypothetical protein